MATNFYKSNGSYYSTTGQKISNPTELQNYAKSGGKEISAPIVPAGATKISGPSGLKGLTEKQITRVGTDIYKLPEKISTDNFLSSSTIPTPEPVVSETAPFVAGLDTGIKGFESTVKNIMTPTASESKITPITQRVSELTGEMETKPADYQTELEKYGFQTNVNDLQNLNTQIASTKAQYDKIADQNKNLPISSRIIGGTADRIQRQSAIELGGLSSMAQALQGNITMAQTIANQNVEMKYEPIQAEIDNQKWQLEQVYDQLTREEKRKADALKLTLEERAKEVEKEKEKDNNINSIMLSAAQNGADSATLQAISKATDYRDAINKAGGFLSIKEDSNAPQEIGQNADGDSLYWDPITQSVKTTDQLTSFNIGVQVGTIMGLPSYDTASSNPGVNRSDRNNNPGNIKVSNYSKDFGGVIGVEDTEALDGGNFLIFDSPESGINAIGQLLYEGNKYQNVNAETAIKIYNGGGSYGALDVGLNPNADFKTQISDAKKRYEVARKVALAEGWTGGEQQNITIETDNILKNILGSGKFTKDQAKAVKDAINNGADPLTTIKNQAKNIMGQTNATKLDNYETAKQQIQSIQSLLNDYYLVGGKTNIFSGTFEKTINKLGEISDPKLVEIATNISAALQVYRNSVSGTAFSVQEGKEIASIFPGIDKTQGLNDAVIKGRLNAFDTTIDASYRNVLGESYDKLKGKTEETKAEPVEDLSVETDYLKTLNLTNKTSETQKEGTGAWKWFKGLFSK